MFSRLEHRCQSRYRRKFGLNLDDVRLDTEREVCTH